MYIKNAKPSDTPFSATGRLNPDFFAKDHSDVLKSVGIVALAQPRLCALIDRQLIAAAKHYSLPLGSTVFFTTEKGRTGYTILKVAASFGDLEIYKLDRSPVDDGAVASSIKTLEPLPWYTGRTVLVFGLIGATPAAALYRLTRVQQVNGGHFQAVTRNSNEVFTLQKADSGAPDFILGDDGKFYYLGSHWAAAAMEYRTNVAATALPYLPGL